MKLLLLMLLAADPARHQLPASVGQKVKAQSLPVVIASDQGAIDVNCSNCGGESGGGLTNTELRATPVPVSGTVATTPPSNASANITQVAGQPIDTNSGGKTDGTLRVVLANDQPTLTNKLLVDGSEVTQPVSGTFWQATQPVSGTFFQATQPVSGTVAISSAPTTAVTGTFWQATQPVSGTFFQVTQPVSIATLPTLAAGTNNIGDVDVLSFPDNEPINVGQINGVAPLMGSGATGTGSLRVTIATDSAGFGTANGTIPVQSGLQSNRATAYGSSPTPVAAGNNAPAVSDLEGIPYVNMGHPRSVFCQMAAGTGTSLAELTGCAAVASNSYYVKTVVFTGGIANAATVPGLLRSGTGTNCGTGTATWATCWHAAAGDCTFYFDPPIKITQAHALCAIDATAGTKSVMLTGYIAP
jgi:hypothetical protein